MRSLKSYAQIGVGMMRDASLYVFYRLSGRSYADYYAARMERIMRRNPDWGMNLNKRFQLDYLVSHGLHPDHRLLDYGCGALAAGILFVEYLGTGNYCWVGHFRRRLGAG